MSEIPPKEVYQEIVDSFPQGGNDWITPESFIDRLVTKHKPSHIETALENLVTAGRLIWSWEKAAYSMNWRYKPPMEEEKKINLLPMPGKVVVKPDETEKLINGIYVIRNSRQSIAEVVAVYDDFHDPDTDSDVAPFLKVGDWVIFGQHSGMEVAIGREKFIILKEQEILCKVTEPSIIEDKKGVAAR